MMFGASAKINVWNPFTEEEEMSLAQIWLVAGDAIDRNTIEVGWQVHLFPFFFQEEKIIVNYLLL